MYVLIETPERETLGKISFQSTKSGKVLLCDLTCTLSYRGMSAPRAWLSSRKARTAPTRP